LKVFRGPESKPFFDDSHEYVSTISPDVLRDGIDKSSLIRFNITKDGFERRSVCTALFEGDDLVPMIEGLLARLKRNQSAISSIKATMDAVELDPQGKLDAIKIALLSV
jgi:hypothetical protein